MNIEIKRLDKKVDDRGWLAELLKGNDLSGGQFFITVAHKGKTKGNHYHKHKVEWFCVIRGEALLYLKDIVSGEVKELEMNGDNPEIVKIMPNILHRITNTGDDDMYLLVYCNDVFDEKNPDTFSVG